MQLFHPAWIVSFLIVLLQVVFSLTLWSSDFHPNAAKQSLTPSLLSTYLNQPFHHNFFCNTYSNNPPCVLGYIRPLLEMVQCLYPPLALFPHTPQITPFTCIIFCTICCQISSSLPLTFFLAEVQCMVIQQMVDMWYVTLFF